MRTAFYSSLLLALLAVPALAQDPAKTISYQKKVMVDPNYHSSWTEQRIAEALQRPVDEAAAKRAAYRLEDQWLALQEDDDGYAQPIGYDYGYGYDDGLYADSPAYSFYGPYSYRTYSPYSYYSFGFAYPYRSHGWHRGYSWYGHRRSHGYRYDRRSYRHRGYRGHYGWHRRSSFGFSYGYGRPAYPYGYSYGYRTYRRHSSTFPAFTILGGVTGGLIGHHNHRTGLGIFAGTSFGLLLDSLSGR